MSWRLLPGYIGEDHERAVSEFSASQPRCEPDTFREYKSKLYNHAILAFNLYTSPSLSFPSFPINVWRAQISFRDFMTSAFWQLKIAESPFTMALCLKACRVTVEMKLPCDRLTFPKTFPIGLFGRCGEEHHLLPLPAIEPWFLGRRVRSLFTILAAFLSTSMKVSNPWRYRKKSRAFYKYFKCLSAVYFRY